MPDGNLRLRDEWARLDARRRFHIDIARLRDDAPPRLLGQCICGNIMWGSRGPNDCPLFGKACVPEVAGGRLHGLHRGHLPHLAQLRRHPDLRGVA